MKSCPVFSRRTRNSGTTVVKSVVTIASEVVPPGAETVEQQAEQNPHQESRRSVSTVSVPPSVPQGTPRKPLQGLAVPQFHDFRRIGEKKMRKRRQEIRSVFPFPVCQRADTVSVGSVPRSVPLGTPRKPLQGLDVPQFHDFGRIGEKNTKNRSAHIPGKRAPHVPPHKPHVRLDRSGGPRIRSRERTRPQSPRRAPCAVGIGRSTVGNGRRGQKEEKLRFFSRIPADFRWIYFKAGISAAVTSARNSGPRRRKTASLREIEGSGK